MVHVSAMIVTGQVARRTVNAWLTWEVGEHLAAGMPELLLGETLVWRVPVKWTSPQNGVLTDRICEVLVDALTGDVMDKGAKSQEIQGNVERAARALRAATS